MLIRTLCITVLMMGTSSVAYAAEDMGAKGTSIPDMMDDVGVGEVMDAPIMGPYTLQAALQNTYVNNPSLRAARAAVKAVYERVPQALANVQPTITASGAVTYSDTRNDPGADANGTQKQAGLDLTQPLFRGGRTIAEVRGADALIDANLAALASTERQILYSAVVAYMDVVRTKDVMDVNEKNRDAIARQYKASKDRFKAGDVTRTDVAQAEFRLAKAEADLTGAIGAYRAARAVFEQIVGAPPENLDIPETHFAFPISLDEATQMAETYNPDVIAAEARHYASKFDIDAVAGELLPNVSLGAGLTMTRDPIGTSNDSSDNGQIGVRVSMPLYEGGAIRSRVRAAKYTANELYMRILEQRRAAREESVRAWENYKTTQAELTSREAQVKAAEIARDGVRSEADLGSRTVLDALDADLEARDAQIALITAKRNQVVAEYALASALGLLLPGNIGITEPVFDTDRFGWRVLTSGLSTAVELEPETER